MVVREAPNDVRDKAKDLAREYVEAKETADIINRYRDIVNFDFWRATCETEVTEPALRAREATWRAEREFENARLQPAKKAYEEAFAAWREVLDASPVLREDHLTADDIAELVAATARCSTSSTSRSRSPSCCRTSSTARRSARGVKVDRFVPKRIGIRLRSKRSPFGRLKPALPADEELVDPAAVHVDDLDREALPLRLVAHGGDPLQLGEHESRHRRVVAGHGVELEPNVSTSSSTVAPPSTSHEPSSRRVNAVTRSRRCSSWISPTSSSSTSSSVTSPSVPPYSSSTMASWFFSFWKSSSSRSSGIVSGTKSARCMILRSSIGQPIQLWTQDVLE
jgi:hypothetical protein